MSNSVAINPINLAGNENDGWADILDSRQVEKILHIKRDSLNRLCMDGKISFSKPNNGKRLFFKSDVYKYLYKNRFLSTDDKLLIEDLIASLNVNDLDTNQRIKMLQIALQYTIPRMKQATNEVSVDLPLFL